MSEPAKQPKSNVFEIDAPFYELWEESQVKETYLDWVTERIHQLIDNLHAYDPSDPYGMTLQEYKASIQMLAFTTTELMAQFCAGGFNWLSTDKARFLSPTVDLDTIIRNRAVNDTGNIGEYFDSVKRGVWEFLQVSEDTGSWIEAHKLNVRQVAYLLWSAKQVLDLLGADERIPGFTNLALSDTNVINCYAKCESPIESILYMQLVMDGLRPPVLKNQLCIASYRVDFAIPNGSIAIECDGKKYHNSMTDAERDKELNRLGWTVLRFPADEIIMDPYNCSARIHDVYPWDRIVSN